MNKLLITAALALSALTAQAQSNVQIYGTVDAAGVYQSNSIGKNTNSISSGGLTPSRIGFKGTEDLGNGASAFFVIEQGFEVDTNSTFTSRQTLVGLKSSKAGALSLGRQYSPGYLASADYDAIGTSAFGVQQVLSSLAGFTAAVNENGRWNNTINYVSPTFYGLEVSAMYRAGEQVNVAGTSDRTTLEGYATGLKYVRGNFATTYVYQFTETSTNGGAPAVLNGGQQRENFLGASYDFAVVKLVGAYQNSDWDKNGTGNGSKNQLYTVGVIVPVTAAFDIHGAYALLDINGKGSTGASGSASGATVAGIYKLSKRTKVYALAGYTELDSGLKTSTYSGLNVSPVAGANPLVTSGVDGYTLAAGINHSF